MQDSASKPGGDVKPARVKKRPASGRARTNGETHPEQPVASSSKLPAPDQSEARRRGKDSRRVQTLDEQTETAALDASAWTCVPLAQHEVSTVPPVWSRDGRFSFSVSGNSVHVHSSSPPAYSRLSTLSSTHPEGHTRAITALLLSPTNPFHLITTSEDGSVKLWDWVEGRLVRTIYQSKHLQILHACIGRVSGSHWLFATMSMEKSTKPKNPNASTARYHVGRIPLTGRNIRQDAYPPLGKLSSAPSALLISPRNTYLVALAGAKAYTFRLPARSAEALPANWKPTCVKFVSDHLFTCGAFSPDAVAGKASGEEWFATGDVKGVIRLWHGLDDAFQQLEASAAIATRGDNDPMSHQSDTEKRLPTTVLHWHAHAVAGIAFTPSGAQLLSVGEESVLVQWHLASGKREYIPRLGGRSIISLAVKDGSRSLEEEWWMTLVDGSSVKVGASTGKATTVGSNVKLDPLRPAAADSPYPLAVHPALRAVVVPSSHPSTLQFVDPIASSILFDLEVVPSNRVAKREDEEVESVAVENVAFAETADGPTRWMATIEGRKGDEEQGGGKVKNLKIWQWVGETYIVNTQFPRPHGYVDISAVMFSSSRGSDRPPVLVTTSVAGEAKVWYARQAPKSEHGKIAKSNSPQTEMYWSARSTFSYRSLPIYAAAISPDSTIVALTHGAVITLWDLSTNALLSTLDSSAFDVHHLVFIGKEGRALATAGKGSGVALWDLLSCECAWSAPTQKVEHLLAGRGSGFYIFSSDAGSTKVASFDIGSHVPKQVHTVDQSLREVCILPPTGTAASSEDLFIGVAPSGEVYRFGPSVSDFAKQGAKSISQSGEKSTSIWQEMFGKVAFFEETGAFDTEAPTVAIPRPGKGKPAEVFNGPSHTLPPVGMLFDAFMDEFIASSSVPSSAKESAAPNGDILYQQDEDELDVTRSNNPKSAEVKYRSVDKDDMKEVEELFKGLLSQPPNPSVVKPQGLPNGTPVVAKRAVSSTFTPATASPASGKKAPVAKSLPATPKTPNGITNGDMSEEEDIGQELPSSKKKDRGKKRKAPREE